MYIYNTYNTVQYKPRQDNTIHYNTNTITIQYIWYTTIRTQCNTRQCKKGTIQCKSNTITIQTQYNAMLYTTIQIQCNTMQADRRQDKSMQIQYKILQYKYKYKHKYKYNTIIIQYNAMQYNT